MNENEVPTRADIANTLGRVKKQKGSKEFKKGRNDQRREEVKAQLPVEVFEKIESDLGSYTEWEQEVDDAS